MTHPIRGRSALLCLALAGSTALAQNTQTPELEEVIVSGSNIVATADFQISYALGDNGRAIDWLPTKAATVTLGVENAFDRDVPFVVYRNDYNSYENDLRGRYIYARLNLDF